MTTRLSSSLWFAINMWWWFFIRFTIFTTYRSKSMHHSNQFNRVRHRHNTHFSKIHSIASSMLHARRVSCCRCRRRFCVLDRMCVAAVAVAVLRLEPVSTCALLFACFVWDSQRQTALDGLIVHVTRCQSTIAFWRRQRWFTEDRPATIAFEKSVP